MVESGAETERVLAGSSVGLCVDTGHLMVGGADPVALTAATPSGSSTSTSRTSTARSPSRSSTGRSPSATPSAPGCSGRSARATSTSPRWCARSSRPATRAGTSSSRTCMLDGVPAAPVRSADVRTSLDFLLAVDHHHPPRGHPISGSPAGNPHRCGEPRRNTMKMRRALVLGLAAGALVLSGCSTGTSDDNSNSDSNNDSEAAAPAASGDIRIDVITHGAPGDSFWDVVKAGAMQAGKDDGVDLKYQSRPRRRQAGDADRQRGRRRHRRAGRLDGQPGRPAEEHQGGGRRRDSGDHHQLRSRPVAGLRGDHPRRPERVPRR